MRSMSSLKSFVTIFFGARDCSIYIAGAGIAPISRRKGFVNFVLVVVKVTKRFFFRCICGFGNGRDGWIDGTGTGL